MSFIIVLAALAFLMLAAYRGYSVILFAPIAALGAVLLTDPAAVAPVFSGIFMEKMVGFVKLYFPVFLLGAVFGKVIELSGFSESIVAAAIRYIGKSRANAVIVAVCALLTYGGVSLFVVVFAVYPFAAEMYRQSNIPKRLMPGAIALGAFSFTMDSLPGTPQIQNIIPTTFFKTTGWAAPWLGVIGSLFIIVVGLTFIEWRRRSGDGEGRRLWHVAPERTGARRGEVAAESAARGRAADSGRRRELRADEVDSDVVRRELHRHARSAAGHPRPGDDGGQDGRRDLGRRGRAAARHRARAGDGVRPREASVSRRARAWRWRARCSRR